MKLLQPEMPQGSQTKRFDDMARYISTQMSCHITELKPRHAFLDIITRYIEERFSMKFPTLSLVLVNVIDLL